MILLLRDTRPGFTRAECFAHPKPSALQKAPQTVSKALRVYGLGLATGSDSHLCSTKPASTSCLGYAPNPNSLSATERGQIQAWSASKVFWLTSLFRSGSVSAGPESQCSEGQEARERPSLAHAISPNALRRLRGGMVKTSNAVVGDSIMVVFTLVLLDCDTPSIIPHLGGYITGYPYWSLAQSKAS